MDKDLIVTITLGLITAGALRILYLVLFRKGWGGPKVRTLYTAEYCCALHASVPKPPPCRKRTRYGTVPHPGSTIVDWGSKPFDHPPDKDCSVCGGDGWAPVYGTVSCANPCICTQKPHLGNKK